MYEINKLLHGKRFVRDFNNPLHIKTFSRISLADGSDE